ncbi:MAG: hypothetical protein KDA95_07800 [Acidimicrobiales bacterium]|nr:hypothetical protein [Acidimicrobiales bacterium]
MQRRGFRQQRFTRDLDFVVAVGSEISAEQVIQHFIGDGWIVAGIVEREATGEVAIIQLQDRHANQLNLLVGSSGIEAEVALGAEVLEVLPGLAFPVASIGHLIALKQLSVDELTRPTDKADLLALRSVATDTDLAEAAQAVALISERGYERGRDLALALSKLG